jgi:hypothetical protein
MSAPSENVDVDDSEVGDCGGGGVSADPEKEKKRLKNMMRWYQRS